MPNRPNTLNPMPLQGDTFVDPKTGALTHQAWWFLNQLFENIQSAQIIVVPAAEIPVLNETNANSFVYVTDYFHLLFWDGTILTFADGGSNFYAIADSNPATGAATSGGGWQPMDGTATVSYLTINPAGDGILIKTRAVANVNGTPSFLRVGAGGGTLAAAVAPTLTMNPYTPAGANSAPALTMNSYTPTGVISGATFTGNLATLATANFVSVGGTTAALITINGSAGSYLPAGSITGETFTGVPAILTGSVAAPTFTGTPATLTGSVSNTGVPPSFYSKLWFRQ